MQGALIEPNRLMMGARHADVGGNGRVVTRPADHNVGDTAMS